MLKRSEAVQDFKKFTKIAKLEFIEIAKLNNIVMGKIAEVCRIPVMWSQDGMKQKVAHDIYLARAIHEYACKLAGAEMTEINAKYAQEIEDNLELVKSGIGKFGFQIPSPLNEIIQESLKKTVDLRGANPLPHHVGKEILEVNGRHCVKPTPQRAGVISI